MKVYVVCNRGDYYRARPCVASIRYFHPDVEITLVKDQTNGPFSTSELEKAFNVLTWDPPRARCGFFSKLEVMLRPEREKFFLMDSDILFVGPVLDLFKDSAADFVVSWEPGEDSERREFYSYKRLAEQIDANFRFPGYHFCNGNIVATSGLLKRADFDPFVDFAKPVPELRFPEIFFAQDQGVINYVLQAKAANGELTIEKKEFMIWGFGDAAKRIRLEEVANRDFRPALVHWAGAKSLTFHGDPAGELWEFFDREYHNRVRVGAVKRQARAASRALRVVVGRFRWRMEDAVRAVLGALGLLGVARRVKRGLSPSR
jgi:hypothetical protein